jgi:hypothetical protein
VVADTLSRRDTEDHTEVATLSAPAFSVFDTLRAELDAVPDLRQLKTEVAAGTHGEHWRLVDSLVVLKGRVYVPPGSPVVPDILTAAHGAGHEGTEKALHRLRADFHIPDARTVVHDWVRKCGVCQRNKTEQLHPTGLLQPLTVPTTMWTDIAMDFIEGLPKIHGKSVILTVVDRFSKSTHFVPLEHPYTVATVACAFFNNIIKLHGIPSSIVSDRDPVFTSRFWKEMFGLAGVTLQFTSAFHPQADGQSEATNKIVAMYLRCLTGDRPRQWLQWLPWAEFCYNSSFQTSLRTTPFRVVYGRDPPSLRSYSPEEARLPAVDAQLRECDEFLQEVRDRLEQAQQHHKDCYDRKHRQLEFQVGQWVWLRLLHRPMASMGVAGVGSVGPNSLGRSRSQRGLATWPTD